MTTRQRTSAAPMVNRCFRHQHPEAFGKSPARTPLWKEVGGVMEVPDEVARPDFICGGWVMPEEPMGYEAR